jgi:hypothetical protein
LTFREINAGIFTIIGINTPGTAKKRTVRYGIAANPLFAGSLPQQMPVLNSGILAISKTEVLENPNLCTCF